MAIARREFLRASSVFALSAGLSLSLADLAMGQKRRTNLPQKDSGFIVPFEAQRNPLFQMSKETFSPYVNTTFIIDPGHTFPLEVTLMEVKDLRSASDRQRNLPGKDCFSLTFRATQESSLKQGTYRVRHGALGTFDLFIVPVGDKQERQYFEAIFNRLVP
jgi:hypothetical protein